MKKIHRSDAEYAEKARRKMMRCGVALVAVLWGGALLAQAGEKKLIEFGWDEPDTAFMRAHVHEMEQMPFDGCVFHVTYDKPDGSKGSFMNECWSARSFAAAELHAAREDLKATRFEKFTDNFLRFNVCPGDLEWFDDKGFSAVVSNARLAAQMAR